MITESTLAFQMQDALVNAIKAAAAPGGRMSTCADVRSSAQFSTGLVPAVAVQVLGWSPAPYGQRRKKVTIDFEIILATNSKPIEATDTTPGRVANLDDALTALRALLDDGNGNGLIAVLNDPSTFGLGGLASESTFGKGEFTYDVREGVDQEIWAYFVQHYTAIGYTSF